MANPIEKIRRGLDAHERAKVGPTAPKLAALAGITGDPNSIQTICDNVRKARARLVQLRAVEVTAAKKAAEDIRAEWKDKGVSIDERGVRTDSLDGTQRRKFIEADIRTAHKERMAKTADEREKHATTLAEANASLDNIRDLWSSPVAVLMRVTLGSEKRATYVQNLAAAGPKELDMAISMAVRTGDRDLAAACCVSIDAMGKESRKSLKFNKADVAEVMVADEFAKATEALGLADFYRESGDLVARELDDRKISPEAKIRVGQKLMELEIMLGRKLDVDGDGETGQREGESFDAYLDRKYPGGALPPGYEFVDVGGGENG